SLTTERTPADLTGSWSLPVSGNDAWLCPEIAGSGPHAVVGLWADAALHLLRAGTLRPLDCWEFPNRNDACVAGILLPAPANPRTGAALRPFARHGLAYYDHLSDPAAAKVCMYHCWSPAVRGGHLRRPEPAWLHHGTEAVEVAGVTAGGQVYA